MHGKLHCKKITNYVNSGFLNQLVLWCRHPMSGKHPSTWTVCLVISSISMTILMKKSEVPVMLFLISYAISVSWLSLY